MATRTTSLVIAGAAVIASLTGCGSSNTPGQTATSAKSAPPTTATSTTSSAAPAQPSPVAGPTRVPCELLNPDVARQFAGFDAERQLQLDSDPPLPVGDNACFYKGAAGAVALAISPVPTDPDDPVNHFNVIQPANRLPGLAYEAYWFGAGESVVVVKNGLLLNFKVSGKSASADDYQELQKQEIKLADQIVPRVG